jgi:pimeloyl-ACP methyl ester carboxylesterase
LPAYARNFAQSGLGVFLFDYRSFGESEGRPRHVVSYRRQREDYRSAVAFARGLDGADPERVVLWGTSYSGGHVIAVAAQDRRIAAVVAQIPAVDVPKSAPYQWSYLLKAAGHALYDIGRSLVFLSPHYVPVFGPPHQFAVLNQPGCEAGYRQIIPQGSSWENRCAARELLLAVGNRPIRFASRVACPTLVVLAKRDQLLSTRITAKLASLIPDCKLVESPTEHFGVYTGQEFERLVAIQRQFIHFEFQSKKKG